MLIFYANAIQPASPAATDEGRIDNTITHLQLTGKAFVIRVIVSTTLGSLSAIGNKTKKMATA